MLDKYRLHGAAEEGKPGEVVVTDPNVSLPRETAEVIRHACEALRREGYDCARSRTRVSVYRKGERPKLGPPDFICRRGS